MSAENGRTNREGEAPFRSRLKAEVNRRIELVSFLVKATLWGACTVVLGKAFAVHAIWIVVLSVFLLSLPIGLAAIYISTVSQIKRLEMFVSHGWLFRVMSRRLLRAAFWIMWAIGTAFFMLIQFHTYNLLDWTAFFLVIPAFYTVFILCRQVLAREVKGYLVVGLSLRAARRITPVVMLILYGIIITQFGTIPKYGSLEEAIAAQKALVADMTGSALVAEAAQWLALYNGAKAFTLGNIWALDTLLARVIMALGSMVVFFNACTMLSCFLIPRQEYRRLFSSLSAEPELPPVKARRLAVISAVFTFGTLFIYLPVLTSLDLWMQVRNPQWAEARKKAERLAVLIVEQVGNEYVKEGTIADIEAAKAHALRKIQVSRAELEVEADRAFDRLERNVDGFLDWYYSLPAEYMRIGHLLIGNLEDYLKDKLLEHLKKGDSFRGVETALDKALAGHKSALDEYKQTVRKIIDESRINVRGMEFRVVRSEPLSAVLNPPMHADKIDLRARMGGGAIAGTLTAVIGTKVVSKIIGKAALKNAATVLAKVVAKKAAGRAGGIAAGAAAGAAVGSAIPGLGTAAGAIVGGIIVGVGTGLTVDKLILMLEEALSREDFKRELVASIEAARNEFKHELRGE